MSSQEAPPPPAPPARCEACGQEFPTNDELHKHKTEAHMGENNQNRQQ